VIEVSTPPTGRFWVATKPWLIWHIFLLVGPFIGFVVVLGGSGIATVFSQPVERAAFLHDPFMWLVKLLQILVWAYPFALLFGGLQAGLVGIVAARGYVAWGRVSFWAVIIVSLVSCAAFLLMISLPRGQSEYYAAGWKPIVLFVLVHLAVAAGCWVLVSRLRNHKLRKLESRAVA
jgi:hypothetical protein